jgi:hypothetical protein
VCCSGAHSESLTRFWWSGALTGLTEGRAGTPEGAREGGDWGGYSEEMRRLLRQPRYFDEDFEAVRVG